MRPASLTTLAKRIPQRQWLRLSLVEKSDDWHHRLLRPRRERPRDSSAAAKRDELASFDRIAFGPLRSQGRTVGYRISEDQSAGMAGIMQPTHPGEVPDTGSTCRSPTTRRG